MDGGWGGLGGMNWLSQQVPGQAFGMSGDSVLALLVNRFWEVVVTRDIMAR